MSVFRSVYARNGQVSIIGSSGIPALKMTGDNDCNAQIYALRSKLFLKD